MYFIEVRVHLRNMMYSTQVRVPLGNMMYSNIILSNPSKRLYKKRGKGVTLQEYLFEPIEYEIAKMIGVTIKIGLDQYEPRINKIVVEVTPNDEENRYDVLIRYNIIDLETSDSLQLPIKRLR